jgi:ribosomal protein S18 acetylase RimI-like enzyme
MKGLVIRPFKIEDTDGVLAVWASAGIPPDGRNQRADIQKKLRHSPDSFFIGVFEGTVAAAVIAGYDGHRGWIYRLAVRPEFQRRGIGSAMVEHAESWLRQQGCPKMKLQIEPGRADVVEFYRKLGFETQELIDMSKPFRTAVDQAAAEERADRS